MNMQAMLKEAQKLQKELMNTQKDLEKCTYVGTSSIVTATINGKKELTDLKINIDDDFDLSDMQILNEMIISAVNKAVKEADADKEKKLGKYGSGLTGLL